MTHESQDQTQRPQGEPPPGSGPDSASQQAGSRPYNPFGSGITLTPEDENAVALRRDAVTKQYPPQNNYQMMLARIAGQAKFDLERCDAWHSHLSDRSSHLATGAWEHLRTSQAKQRLGALHRVPEARSETLTMTPQGCALVIQTWEGLGRIPPPPRSLDRSPAQPGIGPARGAPLPARGRAHRAGRPARRRDPAPRGSKRPSFERSSDSTRGPTRPFSRSWTGASGRMSSSAADSGTMTRPARSIDSVASMPDAFSGQSTN